MLVSRYAGPLLAGHPAIDELLVRRSAEGAWQLGRRLRNCSFDAALVFNTNTRNCLAVWSAGIRRRVCWAYKPVGWLAATHRGHSCTAAIRRFTKPTFALAFVAPAGRRRATSIADCRDWPSIPPHSSASPSASTGELGSDGPLFGVHPGNKNSAYNWPASHYARAGRPAGRAGPRDGHRQSRGAAAARADLRPIDRPNSAAASATSPTVAGGAGRGDCRSRTALVVSSTGPMHLAGVVGTPVVALFSPHPAHVPAKWAPLGNEPYAAGGAALEPRRRPAVYRASAATESWPAFGVEQRLMQCRACDTSPSNASRRHVRRSVSRTLSASLTREGDTPVKRPRHLSRSRRHAQRRRGLYPRAEDLRAAAGRRARPAACCNRWASLLIVTTNQSGIARGLFQRSRDARLSTRRWPSG